MASAKRQRAASRKGVGAHVGSRIVARRQALALTREELATTLGMSGEQLRRYEAGQATVTASRLHELCQILAVPISYFYDDFGIAAAAPRATKRGAEPSAREVNRVVSYYRQCEDAVRPHFLALVEAIAAAQVGPAPNPRAGNTRARRPLNGS